jgi:hypothetical protein
MSRTQYAIIASLLPRLDNEDLEKLRLLVEAEIGHRRPEEFGIWTLPATVGAVRLAVEAHFEPAHYDAVERAVRRIGGDQITRQDVSNVKLAIDSHEAAICAQCGLFHTPPACSSEGERE